MNRNLYRAVWRWHFFAGLIILPVLVWLATTGAIYLYKPELERALFRNLVVLPQATTPRPIGTLIRTVERETGSRVTQVTAAVSPDESWRFAVGSGGDKRLAFVDPGSGRVLGTSAEGGPVEIVKELHSLAITGPVGNALIEIVAGWAIVLVLTGFYLWWPRGGNRALSLAGRIGGRRFWRNFHASAGAVVGAIVLFLAVTGMPWTEFWGARFHALVAANGLGRPSPPHGSVAEGHEEHLPWSLRGMAMPMAMGHGDVGPDAALAAARAQGLSAPWVLDLPAKPGAPYRVAPLIDRAQDARLIYVDPTSGRVLGDIRWSQFGIGAKGFEWGIYTHQGQEFGESNRLVMLAGCTGVWLLAITAPVLWWKRRREGRLSVPPRPEDPRRARGVAAIMLAVGALFPLTGMTMLAALIGEWLVARTRPRAAA